jgi:hypothetical protein
MRGLRRVVRPGVMSRISYRPWQRSQQGSKDNFRIHFQDVICDQLIEHHSAAFTMDQYSDLWPQALEGVAETAAATLFPGDGSKVAAMSVAPEKREAEVIDLNGGPPSPE